MSFAPYRLDKASSEFRDRISDDYPDHAVLPLHRKKGRALWERSGSAWEQFLSACVFHSGEFTQVLLDLPDSEINVQDLELDSTYNSIVEDESKTDQEKTIAWQNFVGEKLVEIQNRMEVSRPGLSRDCFEDAARLWPKVIPERLAGLSGSGSPSLTPSLIIGVANSKIDGIPDQLCEIQRERASTNFSILTYENVIRNLKGDAKYMPTAEYTDKELSISRNEYELDVARAKKHWWDQLETIAQTTD